MQRQWGGVGSVDKPQLDMDPLVGQQAHVVVEVVAGRNRVKDEVQTLGYRGHNGSVSGNNKAEVKK